MSSIPSRSHHHRRRSHSASSSPHSQSSRYLANAPWRGTHKRARPATLRSPSYKDLTCSSPPEKWDVDMWRRGKRARMSPSPSPVFPGVRPLEVSDGFSGLHLPASFTYSFPSTSAAFELYPNSPHKSPARPTRSSDAIMAEQGPTDNVDQLRTDAFWELHRSVAENGEGLVSRMRDWETLQAQSELRLTSESYRRRASGGQQTQSSWTRKRPLPAQSWPSDPTEDDESDEDDDIQIVDGDSSSSGSSPCSREPPRKKRAFSLSVMDIDYPTPFNSYTTPDSRERCSSPLGTPFVDMATVDSDEDEEECNSSPPALTHAYTNSANSSLVSLTLPPPHIAHNSHHPSSTATEDSTLDVPSTASRTENAIAALSLALANGAGGLNDYEALRVTEDKTSELDESLIGEMWH
ncbi:hypothetical protein EIP91_000653 [Steccherinum ochraceum]|uniref:Uncharacterized protein n=1 Tax=Steccherinum ochraceum TaxID=92696 RepID=A0A4R0RJI6_9APHY|nr:hypothetical protein EIP91_000653 [Steccherinum ochraceum]